MVILIEDEEDDAGEEVVEVDKKLMELSVFSASGLTQPKTMKLQGRVSKNLQKANILQFLRHHILFS